MVIYEPGDPVRLAGRRGLFRFISYNTDPALVSEDPDKPALLSVRELLSLAQVVGPIGKSERLYTVPVTDLVQPPKTATRDDVAMHPGVASLSHTAKTSGRRR